MPPAEFQAYQRWLAITAGKKKKNVETQAGTASRHAGKKTASATPPGMLLNMHGSQPMASGLEERTRQDLTDSFVRRAHQMSERRGEETPDAAKNRYKKGRGSGRRR